MHSLAQSPCYVGIDVSGRRLDVHLLPGGECFSLPHNRTGIWKLISLLGSGDVALVVLEPTGGLERHVADLLAEMASMSLSSTRDRSETMPEPSGAWRRQTCSTQR